MQQQQQELNPYFEDDDEDQKQVKAVTSLHSTSFKEFLLRTELLRGISDAGFENPSEVQVSAIPKILEGCDIICQAKSGMGKTAAFVIPILQAIDFRKPLPFCTLVLVNMKELAYQIHREFERLGKHLPTIKSHVFYGGIPLEKEKEKLLERPSIIIGTPSKILDLHRKKILQLDRIRYFILDECDALIGEQDMARDVTQIFTKTPVDKQTMMFSATFPERVRKLATKFAQNSPVEIFINDDQQLVLEGLLQYHHKLNENEKTKKLIDLLDSLSFNQVIIFVSNTSRAIELDRILKESHFPSLTIHSRLSTEERIEKYKQFKTGKSRILISTDLYARGVDMEKINVVINYDMPVAQTDKLDQIDTYLHRVGRTGRFGTKGLAISFISRVEDMETLKEVEKRFLLKIEALPEKVESSQYM